MSLDGIKFVHTPTNAIEVFICIEPAFAVKKDDMFLLGIVAMIRNKFDGQRMSFTYCRRKS